MTPAAEVHAVQLGTQLIVTGAAVVAMTIVHGLGLLGALKLLRPPVWGAVRPNMRATLRLGALGLWLFALHIVEITMFALFYRAVGAAHGFDQALYISASAYTTLSEPGPGFPRHWMLIPALEALVGFVLIGWSTAFIVGTVERLPRATSDAGASER